MKKYDGKGCPDCDLIRRLLTESDEYSYTEPVEQREGLHTGWKVGNLITITSDTYPGLGEYFRQIWDNGTDEVIARVYGNSVKEVDGRVKLIMGNKEEK